jgi:uncharacterized protein (TIGR02996 family)
VALLAEVRERPQEDGALLVLSDWLEENGELTRAELLRIQVELAHLPGDDPRGEEVRARERALRAEVERTWLAPLCPGCEWHFERGLVDRVGLDLATFVRHGESLCLTTGVAHVHLFGGRPGWDDRPELGALAGHPCLAQVRVLDLEGNYLTADDLVDLLEAGDLAGLTELNLKDNGLGTEGAVLLACCRSLTRLETLRLGGNLIGDAGVGALAEHPHLPRLEVLDLSRNSVGGRGAAALAASPLLGRLRVLDLSKNVLGHEGVRALAQSPHLGRLTALDLSNNFLGDDAVAALTRCPQLRRLQALDLSGNPVRWVNVTIS